jgi:RimJ/RimL family protein N-acetyltransferase
MLKEFEDRFALDPIFDHRRKVTPVCEESAPVVYYMGERIYFRPFELSDEPTIRRWINDPRIWPTLLHRGPLNACRETEWIESQGKSKTDYVFAIVTKDGDRLIGSTGLHQIDARTRSATFGLLIGEVAYQNRGFGSEATRLAIKYGFRELNLNRIQLGVLASNWRAIRAYQKAGFVHEGCLRQAQYGQGEYVDEYRFAILREEWDALATQNLGDNFRPAGVRRSVDIA